MKKTQDLTRKAASELIDELLLCLDTWTRDTKTDRGQILGHLFDVVNAYGLQVARPCSGAAHHNPAVDNCGVCAPHWNALHVPVKVK